MLRLLRPRQWIKNLLLLAALVFARQLFVPRSLALAALAFVAFCLASSSVYVVNDLVDVERDREHPEKRKRPIASGAVTPGAAAGRDGAERVDYEGIARASGIERVNRPATLDEWERESRALLDQPGPSVIILDVAPVPGAKGPRSPGPTAERGPAFMRALQERDGHGDRSSS